MSEDTTRARKSHEREGVEYHFISRAAFEAKVQNGRLVFSSQILCSATAQHFTFLSEHIMTVHFRFIEYGEYNDNLYGTSLESIHTILDQNKVCVVDLQPEVSVYADSTLSKTQIGG